MRRDTASDLRNQAISFIVGFASQFTNCKMSWGLQAGRWLFLFIFLLLLLLFVFPLFIFLLSCRSTAKTASQGELPEAAEQKVIFVAFDPLP